MIDNELMDRAVTQYGLILQDKDRKRILKDNESGKHPRPSNWFSDGWQKQSIYNLSFVKAILGLLDRIETLEKKLDQDENKS
ncbi:MAG: hypothetical protein HeimC3_14310 [Candidatus Heimdallarchaeota archaeon LC_3]|nr:MAG: hypothetical protein HeimC3_14310 [Candidatus Heimdallarchaeota archaeon LC_3]